MLQVINHPVVAPARSVLSTRAMLRGLRLSLWDGRKLDRAASSELTAAKGAAVDAARVNKSLVPPEALKAVQAAASRARAIHGRYTLPWSDNGLDILPAAAVAAYDAEMRVARSEFETAAATFIDSVYPALLAGARARLGDLYQESDFPEPAELASRFRFRVRSLPMPDAGDFRVDMSEAQARAIRAELEAESRDALRVAMDSAYGRVAEVCGRMEAELCAHSAEALRDDSELRAATAAAAQSILDDVSAFLA